VAAWHPEFELPPLGDDDRRMLLEQLCHGATSYKEIKERAVWPAVKAWLSPGQQELIDQYAPERLDLPNGRQPARRGKGVPVGHGRFDLRGDRWRKHPVCGDLCACKQRLA